MRKLQGKVLDKMLVSSGNQANRRGTYKVTMEVSFQDFPHFEVNDHILMEVCCGKPDHHDAA